MDPTTFISRFLWQTQKDFSLLPPTEETIASATAAATDRIGFENYRPQFETLVQIMETAAAESMWGGNWRKNERILAITKLPTSERGPFIVAAMQGLAWMDECSAWIQDWPPRSAIGRGAMVAIIAMAGKFKAYTADQLGALIRTASVSKDMDASLIDNRGRVAVILAMNAARIPRDPETRAALKQFLDYIGKNGALTQGELDAIAKLSVIAADEQGETTTLAQR